MTSESILVCLLILAIAVFGYVRLYKRYQRNIKKVTFMFDSIDSHDYSFKFPTDGLSGNDRLLNISLNRIKQILQNNRDEALEREKYYELIINSVDTGILIVNQKGNILQHNEAANKLLGVDILTHIDQVKGKLESGSLAKRETTSVLKEKKVRIIAISDINNELSNQEIDSWIKLIRVLTHEIMNTITPITSLSETLLKNAKGEQKAGLDVINKTGKELISFVENYRKFTHIPTPQPTLFYVKPFIERMVSLTGRAIDIDIKPNDLMVYADEALIAHVVTNVLKNAIQATTQDQQIRIEAFSNEKDAVVIDISNKGELIPEDIAQHIFIPFFTTKKEGSGVGLSLSRQIMRLSNGYIILKQDKEQSIVTFELVFN